MQKKYKIQETFSKLSDLANSYKKQLVEEKKRNDELDRELKELKHAHDLLKLSFDQLVFSLLLLLNPQGSIKYELY